MYCEYRPTPSYLAKHALKENERTLITCHNNADFDAFAAIIAAQFLYPGATLLFPSTQEKALQTFYAETAVFMYNFKKSEHIDWDNMQRLIVVDTRQRSRLHHVAPLLERSDVEIHIWDHHPDTSDDITSDVLIVERTGSTVTLVVRELRKKNVELSCQDATIIGLGIYADTGSFTYTSTSPEDLQAAAWLLEKGMDVTAITDIAAQELTSAHVQALHALLESATTYHAGNIPVVIADASMEHYLGDFAFLAHKLMEMERFEVLFALGRMGDRITVVARSRREDVDVGTVCKQLGGGGHAYAASASVRHKTIQEVREIIYQSLFSQAHPEKCAADYMSAPALGIEEGMSIKDAYEFLVHFDLKAVPVFKKGTRICIGILDAHTAGRAVNHKLPEFSTYMERDFATLPPNANLLELIEIIVDSHQHLVPIVEDNNVIGVVTRTDLVQIFMTDPSPAPQYRSNKTRNLKKMLRDRLPKNIYTLLETAGNIADTMHTHAYVVGGFVRDVLLERKNFDIDIVVEGNGIAYARELAKHLHGRMRAHQKFHTAVVIFTDENGNEVRIDIATARLEYYQYPAAIPTVEISSIKLDLFRRDFTINTLGIHLGKNVFGNLVDFFGGQRDILDKRVRVLHALSFVEDPSRCLRAVRFEQRYDFKLGPKAEQLIKNALNLKLMDKLTGARLYHEMRSIFEETYPLPVLKRLSDLNILSAIHPKLHINRQRSDFFTTLKKMLDWYRLLYFKDAPKVWILYTLGMCHRLNYKQSADILQRLGIPQVQQEEILLLREHIRALRPQVKAWQNATHKISSLCAILTNAPIEALLFMMARSQEEELQKILSRYITTWRHEKIEISGRDLLKAKFTLPAGYKLSEGPMLGEILRAVKAAKLDGLAPTREAQLEIAQKMSIKLLKKAAKKTKKNNAK